MTPRSITSLALIAASALTGCVPTSTAASTASIAADTVEARALFEANIDAIHKRNREAYLATYAHTPTLARNGAGGLELGYENWSARRDSTWPDTLVARNLKVVSIKPGVVYGTYCYTVTQSGTTTSGVSERLFVRTTEGWKIAVTTAFGLPAGAPEQCK